LFVNLLPKCLKPLQQSLQDLINYRILTNNINKLIFIHSSQNGTVHEIRHTNDINNANNISLYCTITPPWKNLEIDPFSPLWDKPQQIKEYIMTKSYFAQITKSAKVLATLLPGLMLTNCGSNSTQPVSQNPNPPSGVESIEVLGTDTASQLVSQGRIAEAAEYYVKLAELLLTPDGMNYADDMLEKAIALAPSHAKANFLSALVKPWLAFKGFKTRGYDLWLQMSQLSTPAQIEDLSAWVERKIIAPRNGENIYPKMETFLKESVSPSKIFRNYEDAQRFFETEIDSALQISIQRLEQVKRSGETFSFKLDENSWGKSKREYSHGSNSYCYSVGFSQLRCEHYHYSYFSRDRVPVQTVNVGPVEAKIMYNASKGLIAANRVMHAFSLRGLDTVVSQLKEIQGQFRGYGRSVPTRQIVQLLQGQPDLFTLKSSNRLSQIPSDSEELLREILDLKAMRDHGCSQSHSFFKMSYICIATERDSRQLQFALNALSGPVNYTLGYRRSGEPVTIQMNLPAALRSPVSDLKRLLPNQFYRNGSAANYPDATMGGLFPDADLLLKLTHISR
jgi:hypothetical protein